MQNARRLPLMLLLSLLTLGMTQSGCTQVMAWLQSVEKPKISFKDAQVKKLDWSRAEMQANFRLSNPYPVSMKMAAYEWNLKVDGKPFLKGKNSKGLTVQAQKVAAVPLPFTLKFQDLLNAVSSARGKEEVPFQIGGKITLETPIGPLTLPLNASGRLPVLSKPNIRMSKITAKMKGMTTLIVDIGMGVKQGNGYALKLAKLGYGLKLAGYKVADGKATMNRNVSNSGETTVSLPIEVNLITASQALMSAILTGKVNYALSTDYGFDTPFGGVPMKWSDDGQLRIY